MTSYAYDERGALIRVTDALGQATVIECDRAGLPIAITDPVGATWRAARDMRGRIMALTDPLGAATVSTWDSRDNPVSRTYPDGTSERWEWDANGNLAAHTDPSEHTTRFETGPFRLVTARIGPDGSRHTFNYDTELRLTAVTNPQHSVWSYRYDESGNLVAETDFNGRTVSYEFDAADRLARRVNGAGQVLELLRDLRGMMIEQRLRDGDEAEPESVVFEYDHVGNLTNARSRDCELSFVRDAVGRRSARTTAYGQVSTWSYDAAGRPASLALGDRQLSFGHDTAGRETYRWIGPDVALTSGWDALGRLSERRLVSVQGAAESRASVPLHERSWIYRPDGAVQSSTDTTTGSRSFDLDVFGRVTAVNAATWSESYAYDSAGNLTFATDTRDANAPTSGTRQLNGTLLRQAGRTTYEYDAQGRLISILRRTLSGQRRRWTYRYDAQDRITQAILPDGQGWHYRYDPLGRRIAKQRLAANGEPAEEIRFVWDGELLAEEHRSEAGTAVVTVTSWDYEPGTWTPIAQRRRTVHRDTPQETIDEQFHAIIADLVGTPDELVAPDGSIAWRRTTGLWGDTVGEGSGIDCPLRFPGQYHDAETGLNYNYQRYYDPTVGRYTAPDPLGLAPAPNQHTYVDNPLTWLDPLGLGPTGGSNGLEWVDPKTINFSQRTIAGNDYADQMRAGTWDWTRPDTALRVMEVNGQLVTYDNRRLDAALEVDSTRVPITRVDPAAPDGISTAGRTWQQAFTKRLGDPRNARAGGRLPPEGTSERPNVCP